MPDQGKLIALEGVDGAALDDLQGRLCRWLRGRRLTVEQTREPTHGPVGAQVVLHCQGRLRFDPETLALLHVADRLDHLRREDGILSWLDAGHHVLCVHYLLYAYASLLDRVALDWMTRVNALYRPPDLTLFIDSAGSPFAARSCSGSPDPEQAGKVSFAPPGSSDPGAELSRLRDNYARVVERLRGEGISIARIDGTGARDEVYGACQRRVAALLDERGGTDVAQSRAG